LDERRFRVRVVGVDGCPGGWLAVFFDGRSFEARFYQTVNELVTSYPNVECIGIDVPIGLIEGRSRGCDVAARGLLGARGSSVFPAPDPRMLDCTSHRAASGRSRALTGKGVTL
jgi:predicted RNase H-like nuclease